MRLASQNVQSWMARATRGLAPETRRLVQAELLDHYWDAVASAIQTGQSPDEAETTALRSLGDANATNAVWHQVYPSRWRYVIALLASQTFAVCIVARALLLPILTLYKLEGFFTFLLLLTQPPILLFLIMTLQRSDSAPHQLSKSVRLLTYSLLIWLAIFFFNGALDDIPLPSIVTLVLNFAYIAPLGLIVMGLLWFTRGLGTSRTDMPLTMRITRYLIILVALLLAVFFAGAALLASPLGARSSEVAHGIVHVLNLIGGAEMLLYTVLCACLAWLFGRAAFVVQSDAIS